MHRKSGQYRTIRQNKIRLQNTTRIENSSFLETGKVWPVKHRFVREFKLAQKRNVDAANIMAFNKNCGQVSCIGQVLSSKPFEYRDVFDLLQRDDIRATTIINLQYCLSNDAKLLLEDLVVPVPVEALISPAIYLDLIASRFVFFGLLIHQRKIRLVRLARIIFIIEQVLDIEGHDRDRMRFGLCHRRIASNQE